jgi:hypothetical protein
VDSTIDKLERLAALHSAGSLTVAKYKAQKNQILGGISAEPKVRPQLTRIVSSPTLRQTWRRTLKIGSDGLPPVAFLRPNSRRASWTAMVCALSCVAAACSPKEENGIKIKASGAKPPAAFMASCVSTAIGARGYRVDELVRPLAARAGAQLSWQKLSDDQYILRDTYTDEPTNQAQSIAIEMTSSKDTNGDNIDECGPGVASWDRIVFNGEDGNYLQINALINQIESAANTPERLERAAKAQRVRASQQYLSATNTASETDTKATSEQAAYVIAIAADKANDAYQAAMHKANEAYPAAPSAAVQAAIDKADEDNKAAKAKAAEASNNRANALTTKTEADGNKISADRELANAKAAAEPR